VTIYHRKMKSTKSFDRAQALVDALFERKLSTAEVTEKLRSLPFFDKTSETLTLLLTGKIVAGEAVRQIADAWDGEGDAA
jgi:hypothetical protein